MSIKQPLASNDALIKILFYIDIISAPVLVFLAWYYSNVWLLVSALISAGFAMAKPMRFIRPWLEKMALILMLLKKS